MPSTSELPNPERKNKTTSSSETGHAKNVANFEDLISFCGGYDVAYNPSNEALSIAKLKDLHAQAKETLNKVKNTNTSFNNAINARQIVFKDLKPLATKIVNALSVSGATSLVVANATTVNRKIQGSKANTSTKMPPATGSPTLGVSEGAVSQPTTKTISTSQQSYDSLIDHFTKIIETVSQESNYKPNETELKTTTLQTKLATLKTANTSLIDAYTNWSNTRIQRDSTLYNPLSGLVKTALDVKKYIKSVFGATSPQFKQVDGLEFKIQKTK